MSRETLQLRLFGVADAPLVASWLDMPGLSLPPGAAAARWAERLVTDPHVHAWLACRGRDPIGFVRLDVGPDRIAELTLAIAPGRRRQGFGTRVLALVVQQARRQRVRRLQAVVDPANGPALAFFAESGFDETRGGTPQRTFIRWIHEADREALEIEG